MDSSLHSANLTADELNSSTAIMHEEAVGAEEEHHIHLPNPSWWPLLLGVAILVAVVGLLFIPDSPWLTIIAAPFILVGIMGWALEDPMASPHAHGIATVPAGAPSRFVIGQDVVDKDGVVLGQVQARFHQYILVDEGGLFGKAYYVPHRLIVNGKDGAIHLSVSESDLLRRSMDRVPDDLYEELPEVEVPQVKGVPMFARGPLSPAETGHYNYGPNFPGINTDAAGSYHPEEIRPKPQRYVADRRTLYATRKSVPPRVVSAD